ncbi:MAG: hypothetical protein KDD11_14120, partial [Acidobacteria bacterium]|nr:hypothetical protein [Acidobacteriota bacterium]
IGRTYAFPLLRFMSVDPGRDGWNMYTYVGNNPVNAVDPSGTTVSFASLDEDQRKALLQGLMDFTGNTYAVDENGNLQFVSSSEGASNIAREHLQGLIDSDRKFSVVSTDGPPHGNFETGNIFVNFSSFEGADYGKVDPRTFNLGSQLIHESVHASTTQEDKVGTIMRATYDWTGPVVDFVNTIRSERGLPTRAAYNGEPAGVLGKRFRLPFTNVKKSKPSKRFYVYRDQLKK